MRSFWNTIRISIPVLVFGFLVGCYTVAEKRIVESKEIIPGPDITQISYDIALSTGSGTIIAYVSGKSSASRSVRITYRNHRTIHMDDIGIRRCAATLGIGCLLEAPTLIFRAWDTELIKTEQESVPGGEKPVLVDDLKLELCGQRLSLKAGKAIVQVNVCENHTEPPQLLTSTGTLVASVSVTPNLASVISKIQLDRTTIEREKELYTKPHHWLYCGPTENSNVPPSVTQEALKQFKLEAFDESIKCADTAWLKNRIAGQMGIGCICKYIQIDRKKAEVMNGR
ncbi:hypothetical protein [Leptospira wolffii]|uniref:hypothetical protein n=1 Tax=Leptospira wolffii TaxID=409998 RepID=UPI0002E8296D|nr:hypothetical protein [Leptospira wolffii]EPG64663.1 putative lipoprotein [Leptospira wolffii serovar Khorat str. Khorat-H2]